MAIADATQEDLQFDASERVFNQYLTPYLEIKDETGRTVIRYSSTWIHEDPDDRIVYAGFVRIRIRVVDDEHAEDLILRECQDHPEDFHKLVKLGFGSSMYLVSVYRGSVVFEIKTDNFQTISSLVTALKEGTFKVFFKKIFMREQVHAAINGKNSKASVEFIIPKQLIEVEESVAAVKEIIELDERERRQKSTTCRRFRDLKEEGDGEWSWIHVLAAVVISCVILGEDRGLALGAALGAAMVTSNYVRRNPHLFQDAETSMKKYLRDVSKYSNALLRVRSLKERDNPIVLSLLDNRVEMRCCDILRKYLEDPPSVRVHEKIEIQIEGQTVNLADVTLLELLSSNTVARARAIADQIENFEILKLP